MSVDELHAELVGVEHLRVRPSEPMAAHVPLRVGGPAELWAVAEDLDAAIAALKAARRHKVKWRLSWPFEDWLVRDGSLAGLTLRPGAGFEGVERLERDRVRVHAATPWSALAGLGDGWWAELVRWPGTPGGLFAAGEQARLQGMCRGVRWFRGRSTDDIAVEGDSTPPDLPRTALLLSVDVGPGLLVYDGVDGPLPPRPGALFADPTLAGRRRSATEFLLSADIAGSRLRAWRLSEHEPGTVLNLGDGTARDLQLLAQAVSARLEKARGVKLEMRIPTHGADRLGPRRPLRGRR